MKNENAPRAGIPRGVELRRIYIERQAAGIAKAKGVYKGRPVSLDHSQIRTLRSQGLGATAIAKQLGCSRGAIYKAMNAS